jgi:2-keto-4-pentenoate hydratase/2-oxohepta-3-ene-1,7-dioic acid hydratase in catechol pathway
VEQFPCAGGVAGLEIPEFPLFFLKATSSIIGPEAAFRAPVGYGGRVFYEGELGVVIGTRCKDVDEAGAEAAIFGYTCVNDITAGGLFGIIRNSSSGRGRKVPMGSGLVGPAIATGFDWASAQVKVMLNGRERQSYPVVGHDHPPPRIVSRAQPEMTLEPRRSHHLRDVGGVLPMKAGMVVEVTIEGIVRNGNRPKAR